MSQNLYPATEEELLNYNSFRVQREAGKCDLRRAEENRVLGERKLAGLRRHYESRLRDLVSEVERLNQVIVRLQAKPRKKKRR